ncbi:hypothetical protein KC725_03320 [Candidatus Peregrinibacteria bacterium]|nr:hypothetical protein [Candidatus Peregrinibacteria bacterium]
MKNSCKKNLTPELLFEKRFIFLALEAGEKAPEAQKGPKKREEILGEKFENPKEKLDTPLKMEKTVEASMEKLAAKIDGKPETKQQLITQIRESFQKEYPGKKIENFFATLSTNNKAISIKKYGNEWRFAFTEMDGSPIKIEGDKGIAEMLAGEKAGVKIDEEPKKEEKTPKKNGELAVEVDEEKIAQKEQLKKTAEEAEKSRAVYWDRNSGLVTFKGNAAEKWKQTQSVTLNTLFPNATEGAQLMVTDKYIKKPKVATLKDGKWKFDNGQVAKIFDGYTVRPMEGATIEIREKQASRPQLPSGYAFIENQPHKLTAEQMKGSWVPVAADVMKSHAQIKEHGYTSQTYAVELKKFADEEGNYWIVLPPKTEAVLKKETDEAIKKEREAAEKRTKAGTAKEKGRLDSQYKKNKDKLWDDEKFVPDAKIRDLAGDAKLWNKEWAEGDLLNVARIKQAFKNKPFDKIPEERIRDGLRKVMDYTVGKNGIELSYLIEEFNKYATLYTTIDGKKGDYSDMQKDITRIADARQKAKENEKEGKKWHDDMSADEIKAYRQADKKTKELNQLGRAAVEIIKAVSEFKPTTETRQFRDKTMESLKYTDAEKKAIHENRKYIYGETGNPEMYQIPEKMDKILDDKAKWDEMWESEKGGFGQLKLALQQYPYSKVPLSVYKTKVFNLLGDDDKLVEGPNEIGLENILNELNDNGVLYKTLDGSPGDVDDFIDEYWRADMAYRYPNLNAEELEKYNDIENPKAYKAIYLNLSELWKSTAVLIQAVRNLNPSKEAPAYKGDDVLKSIFPPADGGSLNGRGQDYYDATKEEGEVISGGIFTFDHSDADSQLSKLDKTTSSATAYKIISDRCKTGEELDTKKLQNELNLYLHTGIAALIAEPESKQRTKNLQLLGIGKDIDIKDKDVVNKVAEKLKIGDLEKGQQLSKMQRELIRLGFLVEMAGSQGEVREEVPENFKWSSDPNLREMQVYAAQHGATNEELQEIEKHVNSQLIAFFDLNFTRNFKGKGVQSIGVTVPVKIAGGEKGSLYLAFGAEYSPQDNALAFRAGIGGSVEVAKNVSLVGGVGGKVGVDLDNGGPVAGVMGGLGVSWEIPVDADNEWEPTLTVGGVVGASIKSGLFAGPGVAMIWHKNLEKEYQNTLKEHLNDSVYKNVEKAPDNASKAILLRQLPSPHGPMFAQLQYNMQWSDEQLVEAYNKHFRKIIEDEVARKETISPMELTAIGGGVGVIIDKKGEPTVVPGIAFAFAIGSELKIFQKSSHTTEQLTQGAEEKMNKQADEYRRKLKTEAGKAGYSKVTFTTLSESLVGTSETGLQPVKKEVGEAKIEAGEAEDAQIDKMFNEYQKELAKRGLKLTKVPAEKMYKLEVQQAGNWQLYIDPAMQEKAGIVLKNGEVLISASKSPNMVIKRADYYYPRPKDGNVKHSIITISDQDYRTQESIINESDYYLDSRTQDQTERKRFPVSLERKTRGKTSQANMLAWKAGAEYGQFDTLDKDTPETAKAREQREKFNRMAESGRKLRKNIGEADIEGVDLNAMRVKAEAFMKKHPREYRLLTTNPHKSPGDIKKIFDMISEENSDLNGNPDQIHAIMEELFNLSMANEKARYEKLPEKQRKLAMKQIVRQRLQWMKTTIYIPFFKEHSNPQNNPNNIPAEELAEAFVKPIRDAALDNPEEIPVGARLDVAVGTQSVFGRRGFNIAHGEGEKIPDHRLFVAKDYATALETGQPPIDKAIALIIRDAESPTEFPEQSQFLASSLATKLALMGTNRDNPILGLALGEEAFNKIVECYATKPPQVVEGAQEAVKSFQELVQKLRAAQEGKEGTLVVVDGAAFHTIEVNGVRIGIRTGSIKSGVYERCLNASKLYDEQLMAINETEPYQMVGNMRVYGAKSASSLVTSFRTQDISIGIGATAALGPEAAPPKKTPPPPETPPEEEPPSGGPVGEVSVDEVGPGSNASEGMDQGQEHSNE